MLLAPRAVFASLRDESEHEVEARQEPLMAIAGFAGIAAVLGTPVARGILNQSGTTPIIVAVWAFLGGLAYAVGVYWLGGGLLYGAARRFGGLGSYLRARSVLALSSAPLALALFTLWPVRILIYGQNLFRTGGDDWGPGDRIFGGLLYLRLRLERDPARHRRSQRARLELGQEPRHGRTSGRASGANRPRDGSLTGAVLPCNRLLLGVVEGR